MEKSFSQSLNVMRNLIIPNFEHFSHDECDFIKGVERFHLPANLNRQNLVDIFYLPSTKDKT